MAVQAQNISRQIFMVDDDGDDRVIFADVLHEIDSSIPLTQLRDGQQLMDTLLSLKNDFPEILFLDINMPVKNGFECLAEIRSHNSPMNMMKIVMLSTSVSPSDMTKAKALGASFYAIKPNTYSAWKLMITDILTMEWVLPGNK